MHRKSLALILTFVFSALSISKFVYASDNTVFGIALGLPLAVPACPVDKQGILLGVPKITCSVNMPGEPFPWITVRKAICFPKNAQPDYVKGCLVLYLIGRTVERVGFTMPSIHDQEYVLSLLKEKYGEPSRIAQVPLHNEFGNFSINDATWSFPDLVVRFDASFDGNLDHETVVVTTSRYETAFKVWNDQRKAAQPKL